MNYFYGLCKYGAFYLAIELLGRLGQEKWKLKCPEKSIQVKRMRQISKENVTRHASVKRIAGKWHSKGKNKT